MVTISQSCNPEKSLGQLGCVQVSGAIVAELRDEWASALRVEAGLTKAELDRKARLAGTISRDRPAMHWLVEFYFGICADPCVWRWWCWMCAWCRDDKGRKERGEKRTGCGRFDERCHADVNLILDIYLIRTCFSLMKITTIWLVSSGLWLECIDIYCKHFFLLDPCATWVSHSATWVHAILWPPHCYRKIVNLTLY